MSRNLQASRCDCEVEQRDLSTREDVLLTTQMRMHVSIEIKPSLTSLASSVGLA